MSTTSVHQDTTKRLLEAEREAKTRRQQKMVRESLTRALNEVAEAKCTGKKLMSFDDFLKEVNE